MPQHPRPAARARPHLFGWLLEAAYFIAVVLTAALSTFGVGRLLQGWGP